MKIGGKFDWIDQLDEAQITNLLSPPPATDKLSEATKHKVMNMIYSESVSAAPRSARFMLSRQMRIGLAAGILLAAAIIVAIGLLQFPWTTPARCIIAELEGTAFETSNENPTGKKLTVGGKINHGSTIITGNDSRLGLEIDGAGWMTIHENSRLAVDRLEKTEMVFSLTQGDIFCGLDTLDSGSRFGMDTPAGTVSVKGTRYHVHVSGDGNVVISVLEGKTDFTLKLSPQLTAALDELDAQTSQRIRMTLAETVIIRPSEKIVITSRDYAEANKNFVNTINLVKNRADRTQAPVFDEPTVERLKSSRDVLVKKTIMNEQERKKLLANGRFFSKKAHPRILIFPFENQGQELYSWIAAGMTDALYTDLLKIGAIRLLDQDEVKKALQASESGISIFGQAIQTARETGADLIFTAGYTVVNRQIRIIVKLIDVEAARTRYFLKLDGTIDNIYELQEKITLTLFAEAANLELDGLLKPTVSESEMMLIREKQKPAIEAYEYYCRALEKRETNPELALVYLRQALRLEPDFADAQRLAAIISGQK